jgi:putative phosphonate catabolism associated alcohol dehydrogenase
MEKLGQTQTIKFQVFEESGLPFQLKKEELNHPLKPGEVLVKILMATICGSDIHTIDGHRKEDTPCILGHEAVGEIVALNSRPKFSVGDRITWTLADSCGQCIFCTEYDLPEKCLQLFKYGHASLANGTGLNGCYSDYILIRKGTHIVKIPEPISNSVAAPINCALATMINAVSKSTQKIESAVIQGGGLLGIYGCVILKEKGVKNIYCLEINEDRFSLIEEFGGTYVDARNSEKAIKKILAENEHGVDVVFEVAGVKELIPQGVKLLRIGGEYVLVGLVHPDSEMDITAEQIIRKCIQIKGIHNYGPKHLEEAVNFLSRNFTNYPFEKIVSPPVSLLEIEKAVIEAKKQKWLRVSIKP